jgi:hypothetical protein
MGKIVRVYALARGMLRMRPRQINQGDEIPARGGGTDTGGARISVMAQNTWATRRTLRSRSDRPHGAWRLVSSLGLGIILVSTVLSACGPDARAAAQNEKARLDKEIQTARTHLNVPDGLLQPIQTQESTLAASTKNGSDKTYQAAEAGYTRLYNKVVTIEHMTPQQARTQAQTDLQQFTSALQQVQKKGFVEATQFQPRLQQAQQQFGAATTVKDYFTVDGYIQSQTEAVQKIEPIFKQLQTLKSQVDTQSKVLGLTSVTPQPLQCARGSNEGFFWPDPSVNITPSQVSATPTYAYQQWPTQDVALFRAASTAQQYDTLAALLNSQIEQLTADTALATPAQARQLVKSFQADIQAYQQAGGKDTSFQQQAAQDAQTLATAKTLTDYTSLVKTVERQRQAMALPLLKAQTQHDLATFQQLVDKAQSLKTIDPANNLPYPDGYEYASSSTGIGDAKARLSYAKTQDDYQVIDDEIQMFITNIQAMLQNLNDKTAVDQPHQTDISLLQHYGITNTRVIVVSLREQEARMYENGKFVRAMKVTTGNPDLPSPPGVHCIFQKLQDYNDISPFPKSSPYYYNPTHINYGMYYSDYGYLVHDAWWRSWFGKYSNLPHYDPISFNNGTHGCVNLNLSDMTWLFNWSQIGTPVILY